MDTGASHHVSNDLQKISLHSKYYETDEIVVGNGNTLSITHTGSNSLPTSSKNFYLSNILCVPSMKRNILSVSKLCSTNNSYVEFSLYYLVVKDCRRK